MTNPHLADTPTSPITQVRTWRKSPTRQVGGPALIDVSQAAPGYPPAPGLREHLANLDLAEFGRYGPVLGQPELREALASDMTQAYHTPIVAEQVAITAGANQAFCLAITVLCQAGDEVILPVPYYFNHDMWLRINGVKPVYLPCGPDMLPSASQAEHLITSRTKAIVLVTPNNPTGRVYPPDTIAQFGRLAAERNLHLIMDETYRDFRPNTDPPHHLFAQWGWENHLIHIHSFSKVYAITGLRVGALVTAAELLVEVDKVADCLTICPNRVGQVAALYGLQHLDGWVAHNRQLMNSRLSLFEQAIQSGPYQLVSAGAYFAYLRHPFEHAGLTATQVARRLFDHHSVLALGGDMFGPDQDSYVRLAFGNLDEQHIPTLALRLEESAHTFDLYDGRGPFAT